MGCLGPIFGGRMRHRPPLGVPLWTALRHALQRLVRRPHGPSTTPLPEALSDLPSTSKTQLNQPAHQPNSCVTPPTHQSLLHLSVPAHQPIRGTIFDHLPVEIALVELESGWIILATPHHPDANLPCWELSNRLYPTIFELLDGLTDVDFQPENRLDLPSQN